MIEGLRELLQPFTNFVARPFTIFHPNVLSFMLFLVAAPGFYFYSIGDSLLGSLFILGALFDGLDGTVAKLTGKTSKFGGILDATLDRIFDGLVLFFIGIGGLVDWEILFGLYILSVSISYIKAKAEASTATTKVGKNQFSVGVAQRGDRMVIIFIGSILNGLITPDDNLLLTYSFIFLGILALVTLVWRFFAIYEAVKDIK